MWIFKLPNFLKYHFFGLDPWDPTLFWDHKYVKFVGISQIGGNLAGIEVAVLWRRECVPGAIVVMGNYWKDARRGANASNSGNIGNYLLVCKRKFSKISRNLLTIKESFTYFFNTQLQKMNWGHLLLLPIFTWKHDNVWLRWFFARCGEFDGCLRRNVVCCWIFSIQLQCWIFTTLLNHLREHSGLEDVTIMEIVADNKALYTGEHPWLSSSSWSSSS